MLLIEEETLMAPSGLFLPPTVSQLSEGGLHPHSPSLVSELDTSDPAFPTVFPPTSVLII